MGLPDDVYLRRRRVRPRHAGVLLTIAFVGGLVAFAVAQLNLKRVGHALVTANFGWIVLAVALMALSLVMRSVSWHEVLRAALPDTRIRWPAVVRATMIGVMGSAVFPGRIGEPSRVIVLARRIDGPKRRLLPVIAGTVFSQTLINLMALGVLLGVTFTSVPIFHGHPAGIAIALGIPVAIAALIVTGPRLVARVGRVGGRPRIAAAAQALTRLLHLARRGLVVFTRPRHGAFAIAAQLIAWALQWLACYAVILALKIESQAGLVAAAAVLLAVNLSAILPATPSNVGVFQAACLVVLAAYGVGGGPALAYGIILQAIEIVTALALGVPALLREGLHWRDIRASGTSSTGQGP
jgi:phosphatidyl-myo-inositol alpha-mannosyltransferase